ncbi:hypothetical protein MJ561_23745 [Klebsiella pneumoniae]|nr:hypothetical protein MJ561_23745 [Klebsiella pneumoniae]
MGYWRCWRRIDAHAADIIDHGGGYRQLQPHMQAVFGAASTAVAGCRGAIKPSPESPHPVLQAFITLSRCRTAATE